MTTEVVLVGPHDTFRQAADAALAVGGGRAYAEAARLGVGTTEPQFGQVIVVTGSTWMGGRVDGSCSSGEAGSGRGSRTAVRRSRPASSESRALDLSERCPAFENHVSSRNS